MRIGIDCSLVPGEKVGVGQYSYNLIKALSKIDKENKYLLYPTFYYIFHPGYKNCKLIDNGNFKTAFKHIPKLALKFLWFFSMEFLLGNVDLVHSMTYCAPTFKDKKKRLVVTIYDVSFITNPECHMQANIKHCLQGTKDAIKNADAIIAISNHTKMDLIKYLDAPEDTITVTHLAADEAFSRIEEKNILEKVRKKYSLPYNFVLFVGSLEPRKNVQTLLRAYALTSQMFKNKYKLAIVGGKGWLNDQIKSLVEELKISDNVYFTEYVAQEDLPAIYSMASVFVYPSLYEGFGLPVLEAMACGTPVITSNVSSIPEVAGDAAVLVDPANEEELSLAIKQVLDDEALRKSLSIRGVNRAKTFSWERCARETLEVYRKVGM